MKKYSILIRALSVLLFSILISSCKDSSTNPTDLKSGIAGTWIVTRTLVTYNPDFPNGYQDVQEWTFTVNENNATLTTSIGSMNGEWKSSQNFNYNHWVFEAQGIDPRTGLTIKIIVEIIGVDKLKGTNETYWYESMNGRWILSDSFTIEGKRK